MRALMVGAGIGGLTAALRLHAAGVAVDIFESVPEIRGLGVGINLLPHAVRELTDLGLLDALDAVGVRTQELCYYNKFGQVIWQEPRGLAAGYRWPQFSIHRGAFQMLLLDTARARLGASRIHTGHHLASFAYEEDGTVTGRFVDRRTGAVVATERADLLIGADGIHSAVRQQLYPDEGPPLWNGAILWRGTTRCPPILTGRSMFMAGHAWQKFVAYPITPTADERGDLLLNWVAERRFDESTLHNREDWNRPGNLADFLPAFAEWRFDWLDVPAIIQRAEAIYEYPLVDRDPLDRWSFGPVTLLGDAAHPMWPVGSNGASQAILDARALTDALAANTDIPAALRAYEAHRLPMTARITLSNRTQGAERVMQLVEERAPHGFDDLASVISHPEMEAITAEYRRLAGFDRDALNRLAREETVAKSPGRQDNT
ncbi:MAG: flavin-dependent oxidoreductase [Thermomicrobiales bacterium]